ncbi:MAG: methylenetetrahydrofolate reductase, partial [Synergistaceae bacterium]|nr:methylenetetrahydrofolate reductase [Synergistaceae bacterium]MBP9559752.1 methylenetetrahydrofolate reductase [Synergistaceae bacterium]MDD4838299.1 methylenetetrahydrofolate reductase [Synergistaceae bacterium]
MRDYFEQMRPTMTFEIFPPKGSGDLASIFATVDALASLAPDLISVTYGAGGTSRENTVEIASQIQNSYAIPALAHLTCAGNSKDEVDPVLRTLSENGVKN